MRHSQKQYVDGIGTRGKFCVLFSPDRELIYGDGFYHNLGSPNVPFDIELLAPITPEIAVLFARPLRYSEQPKLSTLVITEAETAALNEAVQVYSRNAIFYRTQAPEMTDHFRVGRHLVFKGPTNPIRELIHSLPGVPSRDASMDQFYHLFER